MNYYNILFLILYHSEIACVGDNKIIIFGTDNNIVLLCEADIDGAFQTCPRLFYQSFTIHAFKHGKQHPLVYAFLLNKSRDTYQRMFNPIQEKALDLQLQLESETVEADDFPHYSPTHMVITTSKVCGWNVNSTACLIAISAYRSASGIPKQH